MKNVPQNILLKKDPEPSKPEKEPRRSGFFLIKEPEKVNYSKYPQPDAILIYGKPSTPKKEDLISNDVTFSAISERMSFANDIEKFIAPATMERKEENVTGEDPQKVTEYANEIYHFLRQNDVVPRDPVIFRNKTYRCLAI